MSWPTCAPGSATGARVVHATGVDADAIWDAVTERTRVLLVSHVTSPTALMLPIEELCRRAREAGVLSVIDGAHGPGQVPLALEQDGPDFYAGNCHSWLCAPKGAGFLYARSERQRLIEPLVVGWGYGESDFALGDDWRSTRDPAAYLAIPAAIEFVHVHGHATECREMLQNGARRLSAEGFDAFAPDEPLQMASFLLPDCDPEEVQRRLFDESRIEAPVRDWNGRQLLRALVAPYNTLEDIDRLTDALVVVFSSAQLGPVPRT